MVWYWTVQQPSPYLKLKLAVIARKVCIFLFVPGRSIAFRLVFNGGDGRVGWSRVFDFFCIHQGDDVYDMRMSTRERKCIVL